MKKAKAFAKAIKLGIKNPERVSHTDGGHGNLNGSSFEGGQSSPGARQGSFGSGRLIYGHQVSPGGGYGSYGGQVSPGGGYGRYGGQVSPSGGYGSYGGQVSPGQTHWNNGGGQVSPGQTHWNNGGGQVSPGQTYWNNGGGQVSPGQTYWNNGGGQDSTGQTHWNNGGGQASPGQTHWNSGGGGQYNPGYNRCFYGQQDSSGGVQTGGGEWNNHATSGQGGDGNFDFRRVPRTQADIDFVKDLPDGLYPPGWGSNKDIAWTVLPTEDSYTEWGKDGNAGNDGGNGNRG